MATCYRCTVEGTDPPGDPFGVCDICSALACISCGVRVAGLSRFKCVMCYSSAVLLTAAGLRGAPKGPSDPGGSSPAAGSGPQADPDELAVAFTSSAQFVAAEPLLAGNSASERDYYRRDIERFMTLARDYAVDEARREQIDARLGYGRYASEEEEARRADLRAGSQRLLRDLEQADAEARLKRDLLADAFGVAQSAIGVPPGEEVPLDRLLLLEDSRLRFIVGAAAVATGPLVPA